MFGVLVVGWPVIPKSPYPKSSTKERIKLGRSVGGLRPWVLGSSSTSANRRSHSLIMPGRLSSVKRWYSMFRGQMSGRLKPFIILRARTVLSLFIARDETKHQGKSIHPSIDSSAADGVPLPASAQKGHADSSFFRFLEIFDRFFDLIVSTRAIACWKEQTHAIPL